MKNISPLQIGVFVACALGILFAVLIFSDKIPVGKSSEQKITGSVSVWGTLPYSAVSAALESLRKTYKDVTVTYSEKEPAEMQSEFVDAVAAGEGPDLVFITPADVLQYKNKLMTVPYASLPEATFRGTFIDQGSLFLDTAGVIAFPLFVDPMVMYYNRDMITSAFVIDPPKTWDDLIELNKKVTVRDDAGRLLVQTTALGTFDNITHAKELITLLMLQAGNKLVAFDSVQKKYISVFADTPPGGVSPVVNALAFYTRFANSADTNYYSWNTTLIKDREQFIAGNLATYFGYASEMVDLRKRNPNLNFDIAMMPQRAQSPIKMTYGNLYGVAVVKASKNTTLALMMAQQFAGKEAIAAYLANDPTFVPARKDMLATVSTDNARQALLYNSAIIARSWIDPDKNQTSALFQKTINQINAGSATPESILSPMNSLLTSLLQKLQKSPTGE